MEHLRPFAPRAFEYGLAAWSWLDLAGKSPRFATVFGDVLLESLDGWWFLDTVEGSLDLRWSTAVDLTAELDSPAGRQDLLLEDLVLEAAALGVSPGADEVLTFMPHPVVGGRLRAEDAFPVRLELALRMTGELHRQASAPAWRAAPSAAPSPLLLGHSLEHRSSILR